MYLKHHTRGIVVSSRAEGADSCRSDIFTEGFGLVNARVQGVRNLRSRLRSGMQNFSVGEFSLVHGKTGWKVVSVRPEENLFEVFRDEQERLKIVTNILALIKKLAGEEKHTELFKIVFNFFIFLKKAGEKDVALAECLTLMRVLHELGFMRNDPELSIPISSREIAATDLEIIAPLRSKMVRLINESLRAT